MGRIRWFFTKSRAVIRKGPATLRNIAFAKMGIWPVADLAGADLQQIPAYCISLKRAVNKRRLMEQQAKALGLRHFEFVDAVDARDLDRTELISSGAINDIETLRYHPSVLSLNEIACSLSHALAYQRIVDKGNPLSLVLEDDALFVTRRARRFRLSELPAHVDIAFLNSFLSQEPPVARISQFIFADSSYSGSAAAYLLTDIGAQKLLSAARPVVHAADGLLGRCLALPKNESHPFRQVGVNLALAACIVYPDVVLNGSTCHYHLSDVQPRR
jgi:glycosyl transferase family 25